MSDERKKILEMVQSGHISAEEAATLLDLVSEPTSSAEEPLAGVSQMGSQSGEVPQQSATETERRVRPYWRQALFFGTIVMIVAGTVLADAYQRSGVTVWTWLFGWLPLFLGLAIATIAAWARTARWVQMYVDSPADHVAFSFPLPLGFGASVVSFMKPFLPEVQRSGIDELVLALREGLPDDEPLTIEIDNQEDGEYVQIVID